MEKDPNMKPQLKKKMINSKLLHYFFLLFLLASCSSNDDGEIKSYLGSDISKVTFNSHLRSKMEELNIPGLSIAIINEGKIVHHKTMGYANLEKKLPVTDKTIFEGASISKSVFAFFVMKYIEEGKLDLDKPLYEYLPYPDIANDPRYKKITARMVLSHRSGFPNWRKDEEDQKLKIKFDPGTDYEYSGEGYQYLAMVLRHIENTDWYGLEASFQDKIAKPIGLNHTVFIQTPYTRKHKAEPYDENGIWIDKEEDDEFGAGYSIHTEPIDFSKWMIAVMNKELLSEESYKELFKYHSPVSSGLVDVSYTLGFMSPDFPFLDTKIYLHTGNNDGFTCWFAIDIEKDWGFVLFTNSEYGGQLGNHLFEYLLIGPDLTTIYIIGGIIVIIILIGFGYLIRIMISIFKRKRSSMRNNKLVG